MTFPPGLSVFLQVHSLVEYVLPRFASRDRFFSGEAGKER